MAIRNRREDVSQALLTENDFLQSMRRAQVQLLWLPITANVTQTWNMSGMSLTLQRHDSGR